MAEFFAGYLPLFIAHLITALISTSDFRRDVCWCVGMEVGGARIGERQRIVLLLIVPELWWLLIVAFFTALVKGWLRIKSDSILGPWMMRATGNVSIALSVAVRATV